MTVLVGPGRGPQFEHDCESCIFLGRYSPCVCHPPQDLYFCPGEPTVVTRRSSDGPDYSSGIEFASSNPHIQVALRRTLQLMKEWHAARNESETA